MTIIVGIVALAVYVLGLAVTFDLVRSGR